MAKQNVKKLIFTWTVSQWYCMTDAMLRMAEIAHNEGIPVNWQVSFDTAMKQKDYLDKFHKEYGDEILIIRGAEPISQWKEAFPWAKLNISNGARPDKGAVKKLKKDGIEGVWGYCDQQIGIDNITHWGTPWGMYYLSDKAPFIPEQGKSPVVAIPWTLRDLHKCYHLGQAINFCVDPIEHIRTATIDKGNDITFFENLIDELLKNTAWNERVYACCHEEADGPFVFPGKTHSNEGATPEQMEQMYQMMSNWFKYIKKIGATIMTLPQAVEDYKKTAKKEAISSTLITTDKHHGRMRHYILPTPQGVQLGEFGTSGNFPDTLFHYDKDCQLVFTHPNQLPEQILDYTKQTELPKNLPYPKEQVKPQMLDWQTKREGDTRSFTYRVQCWYDMPLGICEWGNFDGWEIEETNALSAKIVDNRAILIRFNLEHKNVPLHEINDIMQNGHQIIVKLKRTK